MRGVLGLLAGLVAMPAAAAIDTTAIDRGNFFPFGQPNSATYGQTFVPGPADGALTGFSLFLRGRSGGTGTLNLRGYVAEWDGSKAGTVLYTSDTRTMNAAGTQQEFAFTLSAPTVAGHSYVAFLSIADLVLQPRSLFGTPFTDNVIPGMFVFTNNGLNFGSLFTDDWQFVGVDDIFFKASFDPAPPPPPPPGVPEPAAWSLMIAGFGATGLAMRRRKVSAGFTLGESRRGIQ